MMLRPPSASQPPSELRETLGASRRAFVGVGVFSACVNILALTGSIYMLQLYDRVLPAHSIPTLIGLTVIMLLLYAGFGVFDLLRTQVMSRIGVRLDRSLRDRVFAAVMLRPLRSGGAGDGLQPVRDLDQIRSFLASPGPTALFDLPWLPFYLGLVWLLHPMLGLLGTAGSIVLFGLALLTEFKTRAPARQLSEASGARQAFGEAARRNAEVVHALGMSARMTSGWAGLSERQLTHQVGTTDVAAIYGSLSKVLRMVLQSLILGLGAYLAIRGEATAGVMIAASILVSRALAPIEIAIANWRGFIAARQGFSRLEDLLARLPRDQPPMSLPAPLRSLDAESLWIAAPGRQQPIVKGAAFALEAGDGLGIIGPAASGKSTLARALVGAWLPQRGTVRLDGGALDQWQADALGRHIGYLPQDVALFDGSVAQNIARFDPEAASETIIAAATAAGVHDLILRLPEGYETRIGEGGMALSAGQRQRVALARALFGDPFLVVLDEPNSNLDAEGDAALAAATAAVRKRGGIVVVIAHRPSALASLNKLLVLADGQVQAFGPKDEVLSKAVQPAAASPPAQSAQNRLKVVDAGKGGAA